MPVDDHPVHPKTIRADGTLWGCNTSRPGYTGRKPGYWAPAGYVLREVHDGMAVVEPLAKWVKDTSSLECHTTTRFDDPACKGCERVVDVDK